MTRDRAPLAGLRSSFRDRHDAGTQLARHLLERGVRADVVVGLPRGGVPVALDVARTLRVPLDVIVVRKLGVPGHRELAMGAIGEDGVRVLDDDLVARLGVSERQIARIEAEEQAELARRVGWIRQRFPRIDLRGRRVVVVDDGVATGSTARAACLVARAHGASHVLLAVPVAPEDWTDTMGGAADEYRALLTPWSFMAVGNWYDDFSAVSDAQVEDCLAIGHGLPGPGNPPTAGQPASVSVPAIEQDVTIPLASGAELHGTLVVPADARGVVVFAHGSGSSRHSPRNRAVAAALRAAGLGTLLFDLLTEREERDRGNVFDIELLAERLVAVTAWLRTHPATAPLPVGYFGASTGAAAALWAATEPGVEVRAVVSRGGRPDLAGPRLPVVTAPTLLVVGGDDHAVLRLNREAAARLRCEHELAVVPGASHLFEEPGTLDQAAALAADWFRRHLG
jgi:putative phosphoribosyl transferase